ncbi:MAG: hypothetical protein ACPGVT_08255 [Maricaulaceae bacterium]
MLTKTVEAAGLAEYLYFWILALIRVFIFILPFLIVAIWRKHPVLTFLIAIGIVFASAVHTELLMVDQAEMIYGQMDPQTKSKATLEAINAGLLELIVFVPSLLIFQWCVRWFVKRQENASGQDNASDSHSP